MAKKYDIIVHDIDLDGRMHVHKENGVMAESPQSLINIFKATDQRIEIVREYEDEESRNYGKKKELDTDGVNPAILMSVDNTKTVPQPNPQVQQPSIQNTQTQKFVIKPTSEPPRFFEIGGIKCKMENGKMYQKQWMRLSETEASEFRIVSDKNNKICPIKDKHIEVMKWVLIDDGCESIKSEFTENKELELING